MREDNFASSNVRCTIAIPVYNRERLVTRAIESALTQTVDGLEILVVDNCSTDSTWEVLQKYNGDARLRLVRNKTNLGLFGNFNRCLSLARGEYLRFLCSDDRLIPDCLRAEIDLMRLHPDVSMLTTRARHVDKENHLIRLYASEMPGAIYDGRQAIYAAFWLQLYYGKNPLNCPSGVLIRRSVAELIGEFDVSMKLTGDLEYYYRLLRHGNLAVFDQIGCEMLIHRDQASMDCGYSGSAIAEFQRLIQQNADVLEQYSSVKRVQRQAVAALYWQELQARSIGITPEKSYVQERRRSAGYHPGLALVDLVRMAGRRAHAKVRRRFPTPIAPLRPLDLRVQNQVFV